MSKIWSNDKTLFATVGKKKDGTYSATINMAGFTASDGEFYPTFGIDKSEGFESNDDAKRCASFAMDRAAYE